MKAIKTILYATDFSECSDHAFDYAHHLAKQSDGRLIVAHVVSYFPATADLRSEYVPHMTFDHINEEIEEGARKLMDKFCSSRLTDVKDYESVTLFGFPHDEIIKKAVEAEADLIVMGTHGRTGIDHVLFGSTAEKVVRKSPVPVMTIRLEE